MGLSIPEKIAQRVLKRHKLKPAFDIKELLEKYCRIIYEEIPIDGVDGVTINLKIPKTKTIVIVNKKLVTARQRFTLAHELGHIIIPWHIGTIADDIDLKNTNYSKNAANALADFEYRQIEQEANSFAAELLMPTNWVKKIISKEKKLSKIHIEICTSAGVSPQAAAIKLTKILPANIVYCAEQNGVVKFSGATEGTTANMQSIGATFNKNYYTHYDEHSVVGKEFSRIKIHWWRLNSKIKSSKIDKRTWRKLLDEILIEIALEDEIPIMKRSINGVVAAANSKVKKSDSYSKDTLLTAMLYSLKKRSELIKFTNHRLFNTYLEKRAIDFLDKKTKK